MACLLTTNPAALTQVLGVAYRTIARLAALVPPPRMHQAFRHEVFASHSQQSAAVTPARRNMRPRIRRSRPHRVTWR